MIRAACRAELGVWFGIGAGRHAQAIVDKLNAEIVRILHARCEGEVRRPGREAIGSTVEQFQAHLRAPSARWGEGREGRRRHAQMSAPGGASTCPLGTMDPPANA